MVSIGLSWNERKGAITNLLAPLILASFMFGIYFFLENYSIEVILAVLFFLMYFPIRTALRLHKEAWLGVRYEVNSDKILMIFPCGITREARWIDLRSVVNTNFRPHTNLKENFSLLFFGRKPIRIIFKDGTVIWISTQLLVSWDSKLFWKILHGIADAGPPGNPIAEILKNYLLHFPEKNNIQRNILWWIGVYQIIPIGIFVQALFFFYVTQSMHKSDFLFYCILASIISFGVFIGSYIWSIKRQRLTKSEAEYNNSHERMR